MCLYNLAVQPTALQAPYSLNHTVEYDGCAPTLYNINHSTQLLVPLQLT